MMQVGKVEGREEGRRRRGKRVAVEEGSRDVKLKGLVLRYELTSNKNVYRH